MKILAPPSASPIEVGVWLADKNATSMFLRWATRRLWEEAEREGVDPVGAICQSAKETGFGNFGGAVREWMCNSCGLKVLRPEEVPGGPDSQFAHATFASWVIGARAHVQHLLAYTNTRPTTDIVDPRFNLIGQPFIAHWHELGGRWAPSATYGREIEGMIRAARG